MARIGNRRSLLGGGSSAFSPRSLPGLQLWFDASQITGLSDGNNVTQWNDTSGYARHATTAGAAPPIYKTNIFNGKPVVRFNGSNNFLSCGVLTCFNGAPGLTIVAALLHTDIRLQIFFSQHTGASNGIFFCGTSASPDVYAFTTISNVPTRVNGTYAPVTSINQLIKIAYRYTGAAMQVFVNDVQVGSDVAQTGVLNNYASPVCISSYSTGPSQYFAGDIAEIVAYNRSLSDEEMKLL